jgi:sialic acid synthase SpsE
MRTRIIAEIGSTHGGKMELIKQGCEELAAADVDGIKFQLFPNDPKYTECGNVYLEPELFLEGVKYARECGLDASASVFDDDCLELCLKASPRWVKFAYSKKNDSVGIKTVLQSGIEAIVSCDVMTQDSVTEKATRLFCIPQYPVYFHIDFLALFPRFDGFSDHTLGYWQTLEAAYLGAKTIEKHVKLADKGCPDAAFALSLTDFKTMTGLIRKGVVL